MQYIPSDIKNILFDLGGVILNIDPGLSVLEFDKLGMDGCWSYGHEVFLKLERGLLTETEFREAIRTLLKHPATDAEIDRAWCAMLIDFPVENVELLQRLRHEYKLYLFSNTNSIHISYVHELFRAKFGFPFADLFVKDYYSSDIKLRKPDAESFLFVLNDAGLEPGETLFIDDLDKNTAAAASVGMHVVTLNQGTKLPELFA